METYGFLSIIPVLVVLVLAITTRRTWEPLLIGAIVGYIILYKAQFFNEGVAGFFSVVGNEGNQDLFMMLLLFGAISALFERSGSTLGFEKVATRLATNRKRSLMTTWVLGILVFADDYLNALAVGIAMRRINDKYKVSRQFLAFIIASTGASVCTLLPFASWAAYMAGLMDASGLFPEGAYSAYVHTIPFLAYSWIALLIAPFFIFKILPLFGPVKLAEAALNENRLPDQTADILGKDSAIEELALNTEKTIDEIKTSISLTFIIPLVTLAVFAMISGSVVKAELVCLLVLIVMIVAQRLMKPLDICESFMDGLKDMMPGVVLVTCAFFLQTALERLGLTPWVIESTKDFLSPTLFPLIVFIIISALAFGTGSFWGLAAIAFPIVLPLASVLGVNLYLASGALISATIFGSQICFFSDCATVVCMATQIKNSEYARTCSPLFMVNFGLSCVIFLVLGIAL